MHQTRKGKQWHFGTKLHVGLGSQSGLAWPTVRWLRRRTKHMFAVAKRFCGAIQRTLSRTREERQPCSPHVESAMSRLLNEIRFHGEITIEVPVEL